MYSLADAERTLYASVLRRDERAPPEERPAMKRGAASQWFGGRSGAIRTVVGSCRP